MPVSTLALYIHWPFCLSKCPYCDFNSHVHDMADASRFTRALLLEMRTMAARMPAMRLGSIFFGGGTPSLMPPECVAALIDGATDLWPPVAGMEITLEANPTSADAEKFEGFRDASVNRLSLGVQSLSDSGLKALGRKHDVAEAMAALAMARKFFPRTSIDLIYARAGQSVEDWREELAQALSFHLPHLSAYQLTLERGTVFMKKSEKGEALTAPEDDAIAMFEMTQEMCAAAGLPAYEISNHARKGEGCRHNLSYWQYDYYVGIGPGAHSRIPVKGERHAVVMLRQPKPWLERVEKRGVGVDTETALTRTEEMEEALLMQLRLTSGVGKDRWRVLFGAELSDFINAPRKARMIEEGLLQEDTTHLACTDKGRLLLSAITTELARAA